MNTAIALLIIIATFGAVHVSQKYPVRVVCIVIAAYMLGALIGALQVLAS